MPTFSLNILIVEDNPHDYLLLRTFLTRGGFPAASLRYADSLAAIPAPAAEQFSLIFLDLYLPDSVGMETFTTVSDLFPNLPIIVLSGRDDAAVALLAIQHGAQDYLIKGEFNEKMLLKTLHYSIQRKLIQEKLRASNERYELLSKVTGEAIWELNIAVGRIFFWNFAHQGIFGYTETANNHWHWWYRKIHPSDRKKIIKLFGDAFRYAKESVSFECRLKVANGQIKYLLIKTSIVYGGGAPQRIVGSAQDIDEVKRMQRQLDRRNLHHQREIIKTTIEVQEKERWKLGRELHDNINQILASCRMCIDVAMKNCELTDEVLPLVYTNLGTAVEEIRKLSRELVPPSLGQLSLNEAVRNMIVPLNFGDEMTFRVNIAPLDASDEIKLMIYRVIQEQLHNIIKYAKATLVSIRVEKNHREISVEIADNGIGFNPDSKREGLGLKNIRFRTEVHKGKLSVKSSPGEGCKISISIPTTNPKL